MIGIHAVQSPITNEKFKIWGKEIADFAKALRVKTITLHPNNVNRDEGTQKKALENLEYFTSLYNDEVVFCIETFEGKRRVFTPDETVAFNFPMTLDTSHILDEKQYGACLRITSKILRMSIFRPKKGINNICQLIRFVKM